MASPTSVYHLVFPSKFIVLLLPYLTNQGNYHPAIVILSTTLEDYVPKIHILILILILILNYCYRELLIVCFFLSLGNRHQPSKWGYTLAFIEFGSIPIYMTVAAFSPSRTFSSLFENKYIPRDECWIILCSSCQVLSIKNP